MSNTSILFGLLLILCMAGSSSAQKQGQLYITGYDKTQPYYFCDGVGQTSGQNVIFAFYNNDQSNDLVIDSVQYICDRSVFDVSGIDTVKNLDVGIFTSSIAYYTPKKEGTDTLTIKAYYGNFTSTGVITCHAVSAPPIAFFGTETVQQDIGLGVTIGISDEMLSTDTMHDDFSPAMNVSDTAINILHYSLNTQIVIRTCGERTLDNIFRVGDSSEVQVHGIPPLPYTMHSGSALVMPFTVTPHIPGKTPHYFVVHTTDDDYLVWSFEYSVLPNNTVTNFNATAANLDAAFFPNPISEGALKASITSMQPATARLHLIDLLGKVSLELGEYHLLAGVNDIQTNIPTLADGTYLLLVQTEQGGIVRKLVIRH